MSNFGTVHLYFATMKKATKSMVKWLCYTLLFLAFIEAGSWIGVTLLQHRDERLFSSEQEYFKRLSKSETTYENFLKSPKYDPVTGWTTPTSKVTFEKNCQGMTTTATYLFDGRRRSSDGANQSPLVAIFGDSFIEGKDVNDDETIASFLFNDYQIPAVNFGVGGFGPTQAILRAEDKITELPGVEYLVLGIMYQNIERMPNSFRAILDNARSLFTIKPYFIDGHLTMLKKITTNSEFYSYAKSRFFRDYWRKPIITGLRSKVLWELILSSDFRRRIYASLTGNSSLKYNYCCSSLARDLTLLLSRFESLAQTSNKKGIVFFMPRNRFDRDSPKDYVERVKRKFSVLFIMPGESDIRWDLYDRWTAAPNRYCAATCIPANTPNAVQRPMSRLEAVKAVCTYCVS